MKKVLPADTNIVLFDTVAPAEQIQKALLAKGIMANRTDTHRIRFVTHLDVTAEEVDYVITTLKAMK